MFCWWIAAGENCTRQRAGCRFRVVAPSHIGARVPVAWLESNETSCILTPPAQPANLKACSVTSAVMRGAGDLDGHYFWRQSGLCVLCASDIGWVVGHSYIVYAPLLRGWRLSFTKDCRPGRTAACVENRREISGEPNVLSANRHSVLKKFPTAEIRKHDLSSLEVSIWLENRWTSRPPVG